MKTTIKISTVSKTMFRLKEIFWWGCNFEYSPVIYFIWLCYELVYCLVSCKLQKADSIIPFIQSSASYYNRIWHIIMVYLEVTALTTFLFSGHYNKPFTKEMYRKTVGTFSPIYSVKTLFRILSYREILSSNFVDFNSLHVYLI